MEITRIPTYEHHAGFEMQSFDSLFRKWPTPPNAMPKLQESAWIWEGLIVKTDITLLTSRPSLGKSTLIAQLMKSMQHGTPLLNRNVSKGTVMIVTEESRMLWRCRYEDLSLPGDTQVIFEPFRTGRPTFSSIDSLFEFIQSNTNRNSLVIIDPIANLLPAGCESNSAMAAQFLHMIKATLCPELGVLLVHHPRKNDHQARGSGMFSSFASIKIDLAPYSLDPADANRRILKSQSRYPCKPPDIAYEWDEKTKLMNEVDLPQERQHKSNWAILQSILKTSETGLTVREIQAQWPDLVPKIPRCQLYVTLNRCVENQTLLSSGPGSRHCPARFRLGE